MAYEVKFAASAKRQLLDLPAHERALVLEGNILRIAGEEIKR